MANKSLHIDKVELKAVLDKFKSLGGLEKEFQDELKLSAKRMAAEATARFNSDALTLLQRRGEDTKGLAESIKFRTRKRKKN